MTAPLVAWRVTTPDRQPDVEAVYAASSRGAARHMYVAAAREAGWAMNYGDVRVVRAPEHDTVAVKRGPLGWRDPTDCYGCYACSAAVTP